VTRNLGRGRRFALFGGITSAVLLAAPLLWLSDAASAAGSITVSPSTGLTAGATVTVSGSGFAANTTGAVTQCSGALGQPTIAVAGNEVPVSCTSPLLHLVTTDASGSFSMTFTIVGGVTGPPATGTDSSGGDAATDAAAYTCPPTTAQQAAGVTCVIGFGDLAGEQAITPILFVGEEPPTTTTTTTLASTTTTVVASTTTTTTAPTACKPGWGYGDKNHCHSGPPGLKNKPATTKTR
jgi:hypothetical protein